ncbi:Plasmid stabilization system [Crenothrix polyspora]|jgi:plasmid stabilization system protein ParE|uniref:Plasmid stabilization system n=1 Tax=Crenothrix polyspora TaxID=360316 RepID=A0A1R4H392_9GAMM|nr:type II toxin-antitoxin system RelE/ParE family toxin [Crenothrix polyspora]SJM90694.1 Plasmid stabilization system [Crenothrix polyspora]
MVKWTNHALKQLRHIHDYIAQDSPLYAKRVTDTMVRKTVGLDELPYMGRKVAELNEDHIREFSLYSYRIIYEIKNNHVEILAVIHKRRDLQAEEIFGEVL